MTERKQLLKISYLVASVVRRLLVGHGAIVKQNECSNGHGLNQELGRSQKSGRRHFHGFLPTLMAQNLLGHFFMVTENRLVQEAANETQQALLQQCVIQRGSFRV